MNGKTENIYRAHGDLEPGGEARVTTLAATIAFDGSRAMGDEVPGPAHLLASALAACALKNVERFSHMLPFEYTEASADVELERQDSPPRITKATVVLVVATDEPTARCNLLHKNVMKYGTISNTLAQASELTSVMRVRRANGDVDEVGHLPPRGS